MDTLKTYSINKQDRSPFYFVSWREENGQQFKRSTKVPHAGGMFQGRKITATQAARLAEQVAVRLMAEQEEKSKDEKNISVRRVFELMISGKLGKVSPRTYYNARLSYNLFLTWLGRRADAPMREIKRSDLKEWVSFRRTEVRASTCKKDLTAINSAFSWALDAEIIDKHPGLGLRVAPDTKTEKVLHEAFTIDEVRYLVAKLPDEWSSLVRCCIGTFGQRLQDMLDLTWEQFDWKERCVKMISEKTGRVIAHPMTNTFFGWARAKYEEGRKRGGKYAVYVHPNLRELSNPSTEFTTLVKLHGIGISGQEVSGKRKKWHSKTFHSLRASVATMLQLGGISEGIAMHLVGHDSKTVHQAYIRPTAQQLLDVAANFPEI